MIQVSKYIKLCRLCVLSNLDITIYLFLKYILQIAVCTYEYNVQVVRRYFAKDIK